MIIYLTLRHYNDNIIDLSVRIIYRTVVDKLTYFTYIFDLPDTLSIYRLYLSIYS